MKFKVTGPNGNSKQKTPGVRPALHPGLETVRCFAPAANRFNTALGRQSDGM